MTAGPADPDPRPPVEPADGDAPPPGERADPMIERGTLVDARV